MKNYVKTFAVFFLTFVLATLALLAADGNQKVPSDIGVRIRNVQLDQARMQGQMSQLQQQYQADTQALQHDLGELDSLKKEALAAAKLDAKDYDVDFEKLEFVAKPAPAKPEAKK